MRRFATPSRFPPWPSKLVGGESIGIDDAMGRRNPGRVNEQERAERFAERFAAVYLNFHRRDGPRSQLQSASRAVLEHLAMAGPLTSGEAAGHLNRAQSVISEIVSHLEDQGLLERESDPADRRRTLVWLTRIHPGSTGTRIHLGSTRPRIPQKVTATMTTTPACESCGMPIETGRYCGYCTDESGQLQSFHQRFERMVAWQARRDPAASREELERQTLSYMATMPAWQDHPRVARAGG
jgi:predicted transcriptional regulator